jgi:hypothetical protein
MQEHFLGKLHGLVTPSFLVEYRLYQLVEVSKPRCRLSVLMYLVYLLLYKHIR